MATSLFTNPASRAPGGSAEYVRAVLALLGDSDPRDVLNGTAGMLRATVEGVPHEHLRIPESDDKWSVADVVQHLADSEIVWTWRLRLVLAEEQPQLTGYDQDAWARSFGRRPVNINRVITLFETVRNANLDLLDGLEEQDFDRVGVHVERGEESVRHMIRLYAGHDLVHLQQIRRILNAHAGPADPS